MQMAKGVHSLVTSVKRRVSDLHISHESAAIQRQSSSCLLMPITFLTTTGLRFSQVRSKCTTVVSFSCHAVNCTSC
jgi:hypothetical protein